MRTDKLIVMPSSTRGPSTPSTPSMNIKKIKNEDDSSTDDLTKDMEEPIPEPNVQEVNVTKLGKIFVTDRRLVVA